MLEVSAKSKNKVIGCREVGKTRTEVFKRKHFKVRLRLGLCCG